MQLGDPDTIKHSWLPHDHRDQLQESQHLTKCQGKRSLMLYQPGRRSNQNPGHSAQKSSSIPK